MFRIQSIFLLVLFVAQTFSGILIYADYLINKKYIASVLCENREMPEMKCDGKCYLRKQLQEHHEEKETPVSSEEEKKEISIFTESVVSVNGFEFTLAEGYFEWYSSILSEKHVHSVFHPPLFHC